MFLHLSVILSTGGVSALLHAGIHPPWADTPPDTMGYGQQAGGTHPTGMHTCYT